MTEHDFEVAQAYFGPSVSLSAEAEEQYERITRNLAEMTSGEIIRKVLNDGEVLRAYWGEFGRVKWYLWSLFPQSFQHPHNLSSLIMGY